MGLSLHRTCQPWFSLKPFEPAGLCLKYPSHLSSEDWPTLTSTSMSPLPRAPPRHPILRSTPTLTLPHYSIIARSYSLIAVTTVCNILLICLRSFSPSKEHELPEGRGSERLVYPVSQWGWGGAGVDPRITAEGAGGLQPVFPSGPSELATHFTAGPSETFAEPTTLQSGCANIFPDLHNDSLPPDCSETVVF